MQGIARRGFEVGVHTFDHVRWQDGVARAGEAWTRREITRACEGFREVFGHGPLVHGAAGWQVNGYVPALEAELGFRYASDSRGSGPFIPVVPAVPEAAEAAALPVPQLPTTLPTLDELIGRPDLQGADPVDHLLGLTEDMPERDQVFTLHAELEGGKLLPAFERLLRGWQRRGRQLTDLGRYFAGLDVGALPRCRIVTGTVPGRSGTLALQAPAS